MRLSDEKLAYLQRHASRAIAEDVRALSAEVRALRECETALERAKMKLLAYVGAFSGDKELTDAVLPIVNAALAGVRALEGK